MNPTIAAIVEKNWQDIQAIATEIGWDRARRCIPHIVNIANTAEAERQKAGGQK